MTCGYIQLHKASIFHLFTRYRCICMYMIYNTRQQTDDVVSMNVSYKYLMTTIFGNRNGNTSNIYYVPVKDGGMWP